MHAVHHCWSAGQRVTGPMSGVSVFWLVLQGQVEVENTGNHFVLSPGHGLLFALSGERAVRTEPGAAWYSVSLRATAFETLDLLSLLPMPAIWQPQSAALRQLQSATEGLVHNWGHPAYAPLDAFTFTTYLHHQRLALATQDTTRTLLCQGYAQALFAGLWEQLAPFTLEEALSSRFPRWMPQALTLLRQNPALGVEELARALGLSRRHLGREFAAYFGMPPRQFLMRRRLESAGKLLQNLDLPVEEIARQCGFVSASHFTRVFKEAHGSPPEAYRKESRLSETSI